jgi:predicted small secreted protein
MKKIILWSLAVLVLVTGVLGCNMARGAGQDLSDTGAHVQNIGK